MSFASELDRTFWDYMVAKDGLGLKNGGQSEITHTLCVPEGKKKKEKNAV